MSVVWVFGGSACLGLEFAAAPTEPWHRISAAPGHILRWLHTRRTLLQKDPRDDLIQVPVRGSAAICSVALLDRGSLGPSRRGLPESCSAGCQAGLSNHSKFTPYLGFIESVSVVCRRPTWPFGFGLEQMAGVSTSPTMLIGLDTAGRVALRAVRPLKHS